MKTLNNKQQKWVITAYYDQKLSSYEIAEVLADQGIPITPRSIQRQIARHGRPRNQQAGYLLALAKGRFASRIPEHLKFYRKQLDNYTCQNCGEVRRGKLLVRRVNGSTGEGRDLQLTDVITLCRRCCGM